MSIPTSNQYPEFVPDQLLTSEHLNNLFRYADAEGRITRTHLVGLGIVCGLEVKLGAGSVTITRGCGVTSAGYLVRLEEDTTYTYSRRYDPLTEHKYPLFLNAGGSAEAFPIQQLMQAATAEGTTPLTAASMSGKAVVMFVELRAEGAKNCDPTSCDDKGTTVTVEFLPMLVPAPASALDNGTESAMPSAIDRLPLLRMPRYDVGATALASTAAVLAGYRKILTSDFLKTLESALGAAYTAVRPLVRNETPNNPFDDLASRLSFLHDGNASTDQLLDIQYYYDLCADLVLAYDELRAAAIRVGARCCPDEDQFPRHLLLGNVDGSGARHTFVPSPAITSERQTVETVRVLFRRMALLEARFGVPKMNTQRGKEKRVALRITPSHWGTAPLSERAIPYYYNVAEETPALFQQWSAERAAAGTSVRTLSYHAEQYNKEEEAVYEPLLYDLEPHNFLRIEGHVGMRLPEALSKILKLRSTARLPFEVVALGADLRNVGRLLRALVAGQRAAAQSAKKVLAGGSTETFSMSGTRTAAAAVRTAIERGGGSVGCHVQDLEAIYDTLRAELECGLCSEMQYFYGIEGPRKTAPQTVGTISNHTGAASTASANSTQTFVPTVPLLQACAPTFRYKAGSLGQGFEAAWALWEPLPYLSPDQYLQQLAPLFEALEAMGPNAPASVDALGVGLANLMLYIIERLWESLPENLADFDAETFATRYDDLAQVVRAVKDLMNNNLADGGERTATKSISDLFSAEDVIDHLDVLLNTCKAAAFAALYREYLIRYLRALLRQKFGFFAHLHPGIQHKAGVPIGGTFILVYHEAALDEEEEETDRNIAAASEDRKRAVSEVVEHYLGNRKMTSKEAVESEADDTVRMLKDDQEVASRKTMLNKAQTSAQAYTKPALGATGVSRMLTEGDARALAFFETYAKNLEEADDADEDIQAVLENMADGTVIADFCLPYLCASDCPPMQFVVRAGGGEEAPDDPPLPAPTIALKQTDFCQDNDGEYPINVTPEGGTLKADEGVDLDKRTFFPASVDIPANDAKREVTISYTTAGGTATITVTVYAKPGANFRAEPVATNPLSVRFTPVGAHAQRWEWDFGDGQTSTEESPLHTFRQSGRQNVTLTTHNGPCNAEARETIVVGRQQPDPDPEPDPEPRQCAPLAPLVEQLAKLLKDSSRPVAEFMKAVAIQAPLTALAKVLRQATKLDVAEQLQLFAKNKTPEAIAQLLAMLHNVILAGGHNAIAFELYRLLVDVAFYIACIQGTDLREMNPSIVPVLEQLKEHAEAWAQEDRQWSGEDMERMAKLRAVITEERNRLGQTSTAKDYINALDSILEILAKMNR